MIEEINHNGLILAIIIKAEFSSDGIQFFTPDNFSQQLAYMKRPTDYVITPHSHNEVRREVLMTKEVLIVKSGKVRVDFYDNDQNYLQSRIISAGDTILLAYGGHGFKILEEAEMIEVKQGPHAGNTDKTRFNPINDNQVRYGPSS